MNEMQMSLIIRQLEHLFDMLNEQYFESELSKCVITIQSDASCKTLGWYTTWQIWKSNNISKNEINLTAEFMNRDKNEIACTLLHEMVHHYCNMHEIKDTSRGGTYHNKRYKENAESHGLICSYSDKYGWTDTKLATATKEFIDISGFEPTNITRIPLKKQGKKTSKSSTRKYACPICGMSVRATKEVKVICAECVELLECDSDE